MSYNPNFYSNFGENNSTFQHLPPYFVPPSAQPPQHYIPPPPPPHFVPAPAQPHPHLLPHHQYSVPPPSQPPPFFIPSTTPEAMREKADQDFLSTFDNIVPVRKDVQINVKCPTISDLRQEISKLYFAAVDLRGKKDYLTENMSTLTEEEWSSNIKQVEECKAQITKLVSLIGCNFDMLEKLVRKRLAKRLRLKRLSLEKKREKEDRIKELKEKSRKIDENLQKIKDDINKAKQEAEEKLQADVVLKEVLRKKSDAKKCLTKLDAIQKLRKARQNTATGRGESVSDIEGAAFNNHIDKLKSLWARKLILYEKEEGVLRAQLKAESQMSSLQAEMEQNIASNLTKWRETLFGGQLPQVDYGGDVAKFIGVRAQWDRYISSEGTALPIGWVPPASRTEDNTA